MVHCLTLSFVVIMASQPMDLSLGQRLVSTLQAARPGASARDRGASAPSLFRHGSVEHGVGRTGRRERSRDQPIRAGPPPPRGGSQNGMDLEARFEAIDDRLDTVDKKHHDNYYDGDGDIVSSITHVKDDSNGADVIHKVNILPNASSALATTCGSLPAN